MPLLETLTVTAGGAVAKSLLKLWLKDDALALDTALSISDLAQAGSKDFLERRRIERGFERIAEQVAEKLNPYLEAEFHSVPENEIEAAILAAQDTIDLAVFDHDFLLSVDLDPLRLEAVLRAGKPNAAEEALLIDVGVAIYDFTMREASNYIVEVASTLPDFQSRASRELLERDTTLIALVEEVLHRLPDASAIGGLGDPDRFEDQYRREVARKLDRLELFGVTTSDLNQRYALSVAYIGLTASRKKAGAEKGAEQTQRSDEDEAGDRMELSVEDLVSESRRSLIRGEAGSGKTTLLQWLAVSSARQRFSNDLKEWNDTVPFFIKLRQYVGQTLPLPAEFTAAINPTLAEKMPDGWAAQQLEQGRGLVLIDGVDELREDERDAAEEWLRDLIHTYPTARYVITSRPPAVGENWLSDDEFEGAFLEPMDVASIDAFIEHWHRAAAGTASDQEEADELDAFSKRLRALVREAPQIRNLATSPLLCAMLCALTRDRKAQLPRDRVELYRIGLEMLLERRDVAREVATDEVNLSRQQKEALLQEFAYWLLINGFSDATVTDIENLLEEKVQSLPKLEATPREVLQHLLMRSGLLRQPVEGRIDFIHRTFLEYLAAKRAVEDRSIGLLVEHAHEDQWQGVVVLAAGLGTGTVSQDLIRELLARGANDPINGHRFHLLAVACLETTPILPKELQDEIARVLEGLIPPKTMTEAKQIASAGEIATPLLAKHWRGPVATVAPSARALGLIGGPAALTHLEKFGRDRRITVARELVRSWDYFPAEEYAQRVLSGSPLNRGWVVVNTAEKLASVPHLSQMTSLSCNGARNRTQGDWPWHALAEVEGLMELSLQFISDLACFPKMADSGRALEQLEITVCPGLKSISLSELLMLETLELTSNRDLVEIDGLGSLPKIRFLHVHDCPELAPSEVLPETIEDIRLGGMPLEDLTLLEGASPQSLEVLSFPKLTDLSSLRNMDSLRSAQFYYCSVLGDAASLLELPELAHLTLVHCPKVDFGDLDRAVNLKELSLERSEIADLAPISDLTKLTTLSLSGNIGLTSLEPIAGLLDMTMLKMVGCDRIVDLKPLAGMRSLKHLDLEMCRGIKSLEPLLGLPNLRWLDVRGCSDELEVGEFLERGVRVLVGPPTAYGRMYMRLERSGAHISSASSTDEADASSSAPDVSPR